MTTLSNLGFGKCRLCVQAPKGKYKSAAELAGKRIVTSFPTLTKNFFGKLEKDGGAQTTSIKFVYYTIGSNLS